MTKNQLIIRVSKSAFLTKRAARDAVEAVFDEITKVLVKGDRVLISGFGTFGTSKVKEKAVEPFGKSHLRKIVAGHRVVNFHSGKPLKQAVW
ncbi:MAG TPA: HU family DNA-binding protein [Candidatus Woesebacteria bacterium]|jgi:nucleoid DNA-binding protein|nr:HU family DNA-binding protein [Candidatus Woesebacteria bacterium]